MKLKKYKCNYDGCSYASSESCNLHRHEKLHSKERPFKCNYDLCDFATIQLKCLQYHQRIHADERIYKCGICSYTSVHESSLHKHKIIHSDDNPHRCTECSYVTINSTKLKIHERKHSGETPHKCDHKDHNNNKECDYASSQLGNLHRHWTKYHINDKNPYRCIYADCEYSSIYYFNIKKHQKEHINKSFKCGYENCNYMATDESLVQYHWLNHLIIWPE